MVELGFEPQPWVLEITLYTMFLPTWLDDTSHEERGNLQHRHFSTHLSCQPHKTGIIPSPDLERGMETHVLSYWLWAIQLASEVPMTLVPTTAPPGSLFIAYQHMFCSGLDPGI